MLRSEGCEVTIEGPWFMEARCASCDGPQETIRQTSRSGLGPGDARFVQVPYCNACAARVDAIPRRRGAVVLAGAAGSGATGIALSFLPWLPLPVLLIAPALIAGTLWALAAVVLAGRRPPAPATAAGEAVWVRRAQGRERTTFFCTNTEWGRRFAALNRREAAPAHAFVALRRSLWGAALVLGPAAAVLGLVPARPPLYIDNATGDRIDIWIDGQRAATVPPITAPPDGWAGDEPARPSIRLPFGPHTIGYGPAGATAPVTTMQARIAWNGKHLLNPERAACHWLEVTVYGRAGASALPDGPQPIEELYTFRKVDHWFEDSPPSIRTKRGGETRVALKRFEVCSRITAMGCSLDSRRELIACAAAAYVNGTREAMEACIDAALTRCAEERPTQKPTPL